MFLKKIKEVAEKNKKTDDELKSIFFNLMFFAAAFGVLVIVVLICTVITSFIDVSDEIIVFCFFVLLVLSWTITVARFDSESTKRISQNTAIIVTILSLIFNMLSIYLRMNEKTLLRENEIIQQVYELGFDIGDLIDTIFTFFLMPFLVINIITIIINDRKMSKRQKEEKEEQELQFQLLQEQIREIQEKLNNK